MSRATQPSGRLPASWALRAQAFWGYLAGHLEPLAENQPQRMAITASSHLPLYPTPTYHSCGLAVHLPLLSMPAHSTAAGIRSGPIGPLRTRQSVMGRCLRQIGGGTATVQRSSFTFRLRNSMRNPSPSRPTWPFSAPQSGSSQVTAPFTQSVRLLPRAVISRVFH